MPDQRTQSLGNWTVSVWTIVIAVGFGILGWMHIRGELKPQVVATPVVSATPTSEMGFETLKGSVVDSWKINNSDLFIVTVQLLHSEEQLPLPHNAKLKKGDMVTLKLERSLKRKMGDHPYIIFKE